LATINQICGLRQGVPQQVPEIGNPCIGTANLRP
jgi:hypothetical protein